MNDEPTRRIIVEGDGIRITSEIHLRFNLSDALREIANSIDNGALAGKVKRKDTFND